MYYTYAYCDPTKESNLLNEFGCSYLPFYIGYGQNNRMFQHLLDFDKPKSIKSNPIKCSKIKKLVESNIQPIIIKLQCFDIKNDATKHEKYLINSIGTIAVVEGIVNRGPLSNLHLGGHGGSIPKSIEGRLSISSKLKGRIFSEETKKKMGDSKRGITLSDDHKNKIIESVTKSLLDPDKRKKISDTHKGKPKSEAHKEKLTKHLLNLHNNPDIVAKRIKTRSETYTEHSKETKSKISVAIKEKMKDPEYRKKIGVKTAKTFKLTNISTNESFIITNLKEYCRNNNIKYWMIHKEFIVEKIPNTTKAID